MQIKWLRAALRDIENQIDYIAADNPPAAARLSGRLAASVNRLAEFPEMGREGRLASTRELVIPRTPWIVVYRVRQSIEILRVLHTSQRWPPGRR